MRCAGCLYLTTGLAIIGVGLIAVPPMSASVPVVQNHAVQLAGVDTADSPLGDGTALVMGGSTIPIPPQGYLDKVDELYLAPRDFTGTTQALFTPEGLYPITGVKSLPYDTSVAQGEQILDSTIQGQIATGHVDADNPVVVFGYSQSSGISSHVMSQLHDQGVPSDDVHFVLIGDPDNPDGGVFSRFDAPPTSIPSLGLSTSGPTPNDLYPTDIYTNEYDGIGDFPRYPIDFLSDLNALLGFLFQHTAYLSLTPEQLTPVADGGQAVVLPGSEALAGEGLTNYYMIPDANLPLLQPLTFLPVIGQPLYDLLEPDMRILVNLGYGSITDGWDPGPANEFTTFGLFPTNLNFSDVLTALSNGLQQGVTDAINQLQNPDNYNLTSILDNPVLTNLVSLVHTLGLTDATNPSQLLDLPSLKDAIPNLLELGRNGLSENTGFPTSDVSLFSSSPTAIINDLSGTASADYATLLPLADTVNALFTSLPAYDASIFTDQLDAGNLLGAIGDPIAADIGLITFLGPVELVGSVGVAAVGTLVNLADLFGLGGDGTP
jgi:hypothetical protein